MHHRYYPAENIIATEIPPHTEGIFNQREITIQSYQTSIPFDYAKLNKDLKSAWLTPKNRLGIFSRDSFSATNKDSIAVVLGLQDNLSVRSYDYDNRRPLWYSLQNVVVETISIHYFCDKDGFLRFTTTGGGRRITPAKLHEFNSSFLNISKNAVTKLCFDLFKLRELCFGRFLNRLYKLRFSDPSVKEYESIDNATFHSRKYIDPQTERLKEVYADPLVKIESFDSDIQLSTQETLNAMKVRFFVRGQSGALRLKLPKIHYIDQINTPEQQTQAFYRIIDTVVNSILDGDYYVHQPLSLEELNKRVYLFPDAVDLSQYQEALTQEEIRKEFFANLDLGAGWQKWLPHLQTLDELSKVETIAADIETHITNIIRTTPLEGIGLLSACRVYPKLCKIGKITARIISDEIYHIDTSVRARIEHELLLWAVSFELQSWDVNSGDDEIKVFNLRWKTSDISVELLIPILEKLINIFHERLISGTGDVNVLLDKLNWSLEAVKSFLPYNSKLPSAFQLIIKNKAPHSISDADKVLKRPVKDIGSMDKEVLSQFGLPLWPHFSAFRQNGKVKLVNEGMGSAIDVQVQGNKPFDLAVGASRFLSADEYLSNVEIQFTKFGTRYDLLLPIVEELIDTSLLPNFEWISQADAGRAVKTVLGKDEAPDKSTISRAVKNGDIELDGALGRHSRVKVKSFLKWITYRNKLDDNEIKQVRNAIIGELVSE